MSAEREGRSKVIWEKRERGRLVIGGKERQEGEADDYQGND